MRHANGGTGLYVSRHLPSVRPKANSVFALAYPLHLLLIVPGDPRLLGSEQVGQVILRFVESPEDA